MVSDAPDPTQNLIFGLRPVIDSSDERDVLRMEQCGTQQSNGSDLALDLTEVRSWRCKWALGVLTFQQWFLDNVSDLHGLHLRERHPTRARNC